MSSPSTHPTLPDLDLASTPSSDTFVGKSASAPVWRGRTVWAALGACAGFGAALFLALALWLPVTAAQADSTPVLAWLKPVTDYLQGGTDRVAALHDTQIWASQAQVLKVADTPLTKPQQHIVSFLAKKYRIAASEVRKLLAAAYAAGAATQQDPLLILAVMSIESNLNPWVESSAGAQGLMQVMPKVHAARFAPFGGVGAIFNPDVNVMIGARILQDCTKLAGGTVEGGLKCYVGASGPTDGGYGAKVLAERDRLERAQNGDFDFAAPKLELQLKSSIELSTPSATTGVDKPATAPPTVQP